MTVVQIIGLIVVILIAVVCGVLIIRKSKSHDLIKWISLFGFISIALTWIFSSYQPYYYTGAELVEIGFNQQGITDIPNIIYNAVALAYDKIILLLVIGVFYAILSKCKSYNKLVASIAEKFKGKEILFTIISSLFVTVMTTLFTETFVVLIFIPFLISIVLSMKLDKLTAFVATFGGMFVGLLGLTFGGDSLYWLSEYMEVAIKDAILYRTFILVISIILFNFFTILHVKKVLKQKNVNEIDADPYKVEKVDKKASSVPSIICLALVFIFTVLGFVAWQDIFGITVFEDFHTWLLGLKIGNLNILQAILGTASNTALKGAFGHWTVNHASALLLVTGCLVSICSKLKIDEFITTCVEGLKKVALPVVLLIGTYVVMTIGYISLYTPAITNLIVGNVHSFNPYLTSIVALITNTLYTDLGLTGFSVAPYFAAAYVENINIVHTIFVTMFGFVQLCIPTSVFLLIGLSYLKIDYKTWIKYIWMFAIGILVILLVLYTIMTYI